MMTTLADYTVIEKSTFELSPSQSKELPPVFPPDELVPELRKSNAMICFKALPLALSLIEPYVTLKISLKLQNLHIETVQMTHSIVREMWESFPADELSPDLDNIFIFEALNGSVQISDVMLRYQPDLKLGLV